MNKLANFSYVMGIFLQQKCNLTSCNFHFVQPKIVKLVPLPTSHYREDLSFVTLETG